MPLLAIAGDLVVNDDSLWVVIDHNARCGTVKVRNREGATRELANDRETLKVVARPQVQWPFVASKRQGTISSIYRANVELTPLADWIQGGASVFFNPALKLRQGETLLAHTHNGLSYRLVITPAFGSVSTRRKRAEVKPKPILTLNERLLSGVDIFEEDPE